METETLAILVALGLYFAGMLVVGGWMSRRIKDTTDYLVAGRKLALPVLSATMFITMFSSEDLLATPGQAFLYGFQGCLYSPFSLGIFGFFATAFLVMRFLRRTRFLTVADYIKSRYGRRFNILFMIFLMLIDVGWLGAIYVAFGTIMEYYLGTNFVLGVWIGFAVITAYTFLGGLWAVAYTDIVQAAILIVGVLILFPLVMHSNAIGGWSNFIDNAGSALISQPFTLVPTAEDGFLGFYGLPGILYFIAFGVCGGAGMICWQDSGQRALAAKNEATAVWGSILAGIIWLVIASLPMLLGMAMYEINPLMEDTDFIMPQLVSQFMPFIGMRAFFIAAIMAALMSSADTTIIANSALISNNIVKEIKPDISERGLLWSSRIAGPIFSLVAIAIALWAATMYKLVALTCVTESLLVAAFVAGIFWKKANTPGAWASVIGAIVTMIVVAILAMPLAMEVEEGFFDWAIWDASYIGGAAGFIVSIILMVVVSLATQRISEPKPLLDIDGNVIERKDLLGWISIKECFK